MKMHFVQVETEQQRLRVKGVLHGFIVAICQPISSPLLWSSAHIVCFLHLHK